MCGIVGEFRFDQRMVDANNMSEMIETIRHRGPNDSGIYISENVGLGHRRLSIIDLSDAAGQPMSDKSGRFTIVYNGEVYNYLELRSELIKLGYQFTSNSDTEVVLAAWRVWGADCVGKFNGMFAFAIYDNVECKLHLVRDRYGIKPLYVCQTEKHIVFASEIKAILRNQDINTELNVDGLVEYLTFQNFLSSGTLFKGIHLLPQGTVMTISRGGNTSTNKYWDYSFEEPHASDANYTDQLADLFDRAVRRQLVSDVGIGSYLSGGIDSGSITALASQELKGLRSFTVGFDMRSASGIEIGYDEREAAEYMSYLFQTEHYQMVLKPGDLERAMPKLVWHLEEPRVGQCYPNFYAAKLASRFEKVVLSGAGGDELFGGYPWRYYRAVVNKNFDDYVDKYYNFWSRLLSTSEINRVMAPIWDEAKHVSTRDIFAQVFSNHSDSLSRPEDYINHSLYFEARTFLQGVLMVEDKLSMAYGLETRVPFLDNDLVDFAMKLPVRFKLGNLGEVVELNENEPGPKTQVYFENTKDGKLLLRDVLRKLVPSDIADKKKQGFSGPDGSWFRGDSIDYVNRTLFDDSALIYQFLDPREVQNMLTEHISGRQNRRLLVWSFLYLEQWCQTFLNNKPGLAS